MSPRIPVEDRVQREIDDGLALDPLLNDERIKAWFARRQTELAEKMIGREPTDDAGRRGDALQVKAIRDLHAYLAKTVSDGQRAMVKMEKLNERRTRD